MNAFLAFSHRRWHRTQRHNSTFLTSKLDEVLNNQCWSLFEPGLLFPITTDRLFRAPSNFLRRFDRDEQWKKTQIRKVCMGYRNDWYRNDDRAARRAVFFSGWNAAKKNYQPLYRREGKLELLRSI